MSGLPTQPPLTPAAGGAPLATGEVIEAGEVAVSERASPAADVPAVGAHMAGSGAVLLSRRAAPSASLVRRLALEWLPRLLVGVIFIYAGWGKIRNVESLTQFVKEVRAYQLAPLAASNMIAYTMPWLELLAVGCLLSGLFRREARWLLLGMLSLFLFAKAYAYFVHGLTECGCVPKDSLMYPLFHGATGYLTNAALIGLLLLEGWHERRRIRFSRVEIGRDSAPAAS